MGEWRRNCTKRDSWNENNIKTAVNYSRTASDSSEITIFDEIIDLHEMILLLDFAVVAKQANFMVGYSEYVFEYSGRLLQS